MKLVFPCRNSVLKAITLSPKRNQFILPLIQNQRVLKVNKFWEMEEIRNEIRHVFSKTKPRSHTISRLSPDSLHKLCHMDSSLQQAAKIVSREKERVRKSFKSFLSTWTVLINSLTKAQFSSQSLRFLAALVLPISRFPRSIETCRLAKLVKWAISVQFFLVWSASTAWNRSPLVQTWNQVLRELEKFSAVVQVLNQIAALNHLKVTAGENL